MKKLHVVFFGAHPDDECLAAVALKRLVEAGHRVTVVCVTMCRRDWKERNLAGPHVREPELRASVKLLGAELIMLKLHEHEVAETPELRTLFGNLIREMKPDIVITHEHDDMNPDHRGVSSLVLGQLLQVGVNIPLLTVYATSGMHKPQTQSFLPSYGVLVGPEEWSIVAKTQACHASQNPGARISAYRMIALIRGREWGVPLVEAYGFRRRIGGLPDEVGDIFVPAPFTLPFNPRPIRASAEMIGITNEEADILAQTTF